MSFIPSQLLRDAGHYEPALDCDCQSFVSELLDSEFKLKELIAILSFLLFVATTVAVSLWCGVNIKPRRPKYWRNRRWFLFSDSFYGEYDVTDELRDSIQRLFDMTTRTEFMGQGRDGAWATHKRFRVVSVTRIENGHLWSRYSRFRRSVVQVVRRVSQMPPDWARYLTETLQGIDATHAASQTDLSVRSFVSKLNLDHSRNERLLFHGCPGAGAVDEQGRILFNAQENSPVDAIKHVGFDERLGNVKGMYGAGTYFADMSSKADQYAGQYNPPGTPGGSIGERATMFLSRVVLGSPYTTNQSLEQLKRPPCLHGFFDLQLKMNREVLGGRPWPQKGVPFHVCSHPRFDSVVGAMVVDGRRKNYREYVVYDSDQCYPEFCVVYERIA